MEHIILNVEDVVPGDVLLCRADSLSCEISDVTGSKYVHAAICIDANLAAEASGLRVKETKIDNLLATYDHVAVLHQPDCWSPSRIERLRSFIKAAIDRKAKFNCEGIRSFEESKQLHIENVVTKLNDFFENNRAGSIVERESYFCSELVAAAHFAVGIIEPSAAVVYDPSIMVPGEFANSFTYGIFAGYLIPYKGYRVPEDDEFRFAATIHEIFP
jgi:hypothetical protein